MLNCGLLFNCSIFIFVALRKLWQSRGAAEQVNSRNSEPATDGSPKKFPLSLV